MKARILAYDEACDWPRLPLARGETAWRKFVTSNPSETLRLSMWT
jgi:hypothetical protein